MPWFGDKCFEESEKYSCGCIKYYNWQPVMEDKHIKIGITYDYCKKHGKENTKRKLAELKSQMGESEFSWQSILLILLILSGFVMFFYISNR